MTDRDSEVARIAEAWNASGLGYRMTWDESARLYDAGLRSTSRDSELRDLMAGHVANLAPLDLDGIEMRWATEWGESDDGQKQDRGADREDVTR